MDPINWPSVLLSAALAPLVSTLWYGRLLSRTRGGRRAGRIRALAAAGVLHLVAAVMIGHALARIGADKLAAKPWLYWMQTGGIALAFVIPALWSSYLRIGARRRDALADAGYWLVVYLLTGTVFWALA